MTDSTGKVVEDLTCEQAKQTEDEKLIEEFCPADKDGKGDKGDSDPIDDAKDEVERTAKQTKDTVEKTVSPDEPEDDPEGGGGGGGGGEQPAGGVVPPAGGGSGGGDGGGKGDSKDVQAAGGYESPRGIERGPNNNSNNGSAASGSYGSGSYTAGMRSESELTLQPFAAPLVSVPPVYEFPEIADQLFTDDEPAVAGQPVIAPDGTVMTPSTTAMNSYNENGFAATAGDPTGWLAATATGLIMLVGAAHALNGGRTPRRSEA